MQAIEEEVVAVATRTTVPPARLRTVDGSVGRLLEAFGRVPVAACTAFPIDWMSTVAAT